MPAIAATSRRVWQRCWLPVSTGATQTLRLQVHGGNGYAMEYEISRVLCDAPILNIFESAAEIQANVIGRGLLSRQN